MKIHPQVITQNNVPAFIVLSYKEYNTLLDTIEDQEDIDAIQDFRQHPHETIPFELVQTIANGKNAIRVFREFREISQSELAKKVGISRQYLCQIEKGERQGSGKTLKKIADLLKVDLEVLID